ncbi:MAG: PD-(D/E)XK nuclease family protein [Alistipes sp.]|nr:PD-(D/E)XK nuclease family protein [Candidatus Alistipes equi]
MKFIEELASAIWNKYPNEFGTLKIVVSSSRIRVFLNEAIKKYLNGSSFEAEYVSMDDLVLQCIKLDNPVQIKLLSELYKVYNKHFPSETFDHFYNWGQILLKDFDMIDRHLIDAGQVFQNISDLKELDTVFDYLNEEQRKVISEFWNHMYSGDNFSQSEYKKRFLDIWRKLGAIYEEFNKSLLSQGLAYMGMIYRKVALDENLAIEDDNILFVGFNTVSPAEKKIIERLRKNNNVSFAWDVDDYYLYDTSQEAGYYIRENVREFENLPQITTNHISNIKSFNIFPCGSDILSIQHVSNILQSLEEDGKKLDRETVIVLPKEGLLVPLLYALPKKYSPLNVTMGYPFSTSGAFSLVELLLLLQMNVKFSDGEAFFYHEDVEHILMHPYLRESNPEVYDRVRRHIINQRLIRVPLSVFGPCDELGIFRVVDDVKALFIYLESVMRTLMDKLQPSADVKLRREFLYTAAEELSCLNRTILDTQIELTLGIASLLIKKHLSDVTIPFKGDFSEGIQIMGMLETRCLDFKNVIILSMTDDNYPGRNLSDQSFIPPVIRYAYDLPTPQSKEAMYAYNFYRLLQRAENVFLLYCSSSGGMTTGEKSRYIRQLEMELIPKLENVTVNTCSVGVGVDMLRSKPLEIPKDEYVKSILESYTKKGGRILYPSDFSTYLSCPMKFYFSRIAGLTEEKTLDENMDNSMFGNIFHEAADIIYNEVKNIFDARSALGKIGDDKVNDAINSAINKFYSNKESASSIPEIEVIRKIIFDYLKNLLKFDSLYQLQFSVKYLEETITYCFEFDNDSSRCVNLGGRLDRMDHIQKSAWEKLIRIVDYKTGSSDGKKNFTSVEKLLKIENDDEEVNSNIVNTLIYCLIMYHNLVDGDKLKDVCPALYYVRDMHSDYNPNITITQQEFDVKSGKQKNVKKELTYSMIQTQFENSLSNRLAELFDYSIPFKQRRSKNCKEYCPYFDVCGAPENLEGE